MDYQNSLHQHSRAQGIHISVATVNHSPPLVPYATVSPQEVLHRTVETHTADSCGAKKDTQQSSHSLASSNVVCTTEMSCCTISHNHCSATTSQGAASTVAVSDPDMAALGPFWSDPSSVDIQKKMMRIVQKEQPISTLSLFETLLQQQHGVTSLPRLTSIELSRLLYFLKDRGAIMAHLYSGIPLECGDVAKSWYTTPATLQAFEQWIETLAQKVRAKPQDQTIVIGLKKTIESIKPFCVHHVLKQKLARVLMIEPKPCTPIAAAAAPAITNIPPVTQTTTASNNDSNLTFVAQVEKAWSTTDKSQLVSVELPTLLSALYHGTASQSKSLILHVTDILLTVLNKTNNNAVTKYTVLILSPDATLDWTTETSIYPHLFPMTMEVLNKPGDLKYRFV